MAEDGNHILVIKHGALGDVVLQQNNFRDIRETHPDAEITVLTTPPYADLFARCPYVDTVLTENRAPPGSAANIYVLRLINDRRYTIIYDLMHQSNRTFIYRLLYYGNASWHYGAGLGAIPRFGSRRCKDSSAGDIDIPPLDWLGNDCSALLSSRGVTGDYIVLIPGCSGKNQHKRWPHYAELAAAIIDAGHAVVTAPGPDEMLLSLPGVRMVGAEGKHLDIFDLTGLIQGARLVVGNDTGPTHIAAMSKVATIMVLQHPPAAGFVRVVGDRMRLLYNRDGGTLSPREVLAAVTEQLRQPPRKT